MKIIKTGEASEKHTQMENLYHYMYLEYYLES